MKTRAFGQLLVVLNTFLLEFRKKSKYSDLALLRRITKVAEQLNNSRPTFPFSEVTGMVIAWANRAIEEEKDVREYVTKCIEGYLIGIRERRLGRIQRIAQLIKDGDSILTHCNVSGELAMAASICQKDNKEIEKEYGAMADLARHLDRTRQQVHHWLNSDTIPNYDTAIQMKEWLEERQK